MSNYDKDYYDVNLNFIGLAEFWDDHMQQIARNRAVLKTERLLRAKLNTSGFL